MYFSVLGDNGGVCLCPSEAVCGLIYTHLRIMKSVLETECAFPASQTFGSGVPLLTSIVSPKKKSQAHGSLGVRKLSPM